MSSDAFGYERVDDASGAPTPAPTRKPKGLVVAIFFFATLCIILAITLAVEFSNRNDNTVSFAKCFIKGLNGKNVTGVVHFKRDEYVTRISGQVHGLEPYNDHGFHIHTFGDGGINQPFTMGRIYNPDNKKHGCLDSEERQVGDLGNLQANDHGVATVNQHNTLVHLGGPWSVLGRALVIKSQRDNCAPPDGAAGAPYAHCTIEISSN